MKILVIHIEDSSTDFLKEIYKDKEVTLITRETSNRELKRLIKSHDRIIMLGHGDEWGLFGHFKYLIDSSFVFQLRQKSCVFIWCNADVFVQRHGLKGLYTGMIISEHEEAMLCCLHNFTNADVEESNILFAQAMTKAINGNLNEARELYVSDKNPIIDYNKQRIYEK